MRLLPIIRPRVRSLVAVTRDPDSVLARASNGWLDSGTGVYPAQKGPAGVGTTDEADSALPAPTSSVVAALAIGDALALTLSRMKMGWHKDGKDRRSRFHYNHPGGQLGIEVSNRSLEFRLDRLLIRFCRFLPPQLGREGRISPPSVSADPNPVTGSLASPSSALPIPASPLR